MSLMPTKEEIIESLKREIEWLKTENEMLKMAIAEMSKEDVCNCGMDKHGCAPAEKWLQCPVHSKTVKRMGDL